MRATLSVIIGTVTVLLCTSQAAAGQPGRIAPSAADPPYRVYYGGDVISDPMPAGAPKPKISRQQAIAAISAGRYVPIEPGRPQATLRMVILNVPHVTRSHPAWVLIWSNVQVVSHGKFSGTLRPIQIDRHAIAVEIVDATTGRVASGAWIIGSGAQRHD